MKNMGKILLTLAVVLMAGITGCGDPGGGSSTPPDTWGNPPAALVGTWLSSGVSPVFTINADGTGTMGASPVDSWKVKGSELRLTISGVVTTVTWSISGDTLTLGDPSSGPMATTLKSYSDLGLTKKAGSGDITYTVTGNSSSSSTTTTSLTFTFSVDPGTLTAGDISVGGNASKGSGATVTGTGTSRTLSPITVSATGLATVSITKDGIESEPKNPQVYLEGDEGPSGGTIPEALVAKWFTSQDLADNETLVYMMFEFTSDGRFLAGPSGAEAPYNYSVSGDTITFTMSNGFTVGDILFQINGTSMILSGSTGGFQSIEGTYYKKAGGSSGNITYTVTGNSSSSAATTTSLLFTFSTNPGTLNVSDITLGGNAALGANPTLVASGGFNRTLSPIIVSATGTATVSISKEGIEAGTKNVPVYKEGESSGGTPQEALIAKWYINQELADNPMGLPANYEFKSDGSYIVGGLPTQGLLTYTATDTTITTRVSGIAQGEISYVINGTALTLFDDRGLASFGSGLAPDTYYKKGDGGGISDITYTVTGDSNSTASTTTSLTFTFSTDPGALTASDINVSGSASKGSATLTGTGTTRTLSPITVSANGSASVSISRTGITSDSKNVDVYLEEVSDPITYTVTANGDATTTTTSLTFTFSEDPGDITASSINVSGPASKGSATLTGTGTTRTLSPITVSRSGWATVSINRTGIETGNKGMLVYTGIDITYTVTANGDATTATTALTFTFSQEPSPYLTASDIFLSMNASKGSATLTGTGTTRTLSPITVTTTGNLTVFINSTYTLNIDPSEKSVYVYQGPQDITYSVTANGNATTTTTALTFSFSADPGVLTESNISLSGNASMGSATLSGSGTIRTLSPITVSGSGYASVYITRTGIETGSKNVSMYYNPWGYPPAALVGTWIASVTKDTVITMNANGIGNFLTNSGTWTVNGTQLRFTYSGVVVATVTWSVSGDKLTLGHPSSGGSAPQMIMLSDQGLIKQ
ncbi:MAG: hypothetical protein FWG99_08885 [Treponema sp.]|nr:hypothetical protein [Treponema sp.]